MELIDLTFSPIRGPKGNMEFLGYVSNIEGSGNTDADKVDVLADAVVDAAHEELLKKQ